MKLIEYKDYTITIADEAYLVKPFRDLLKLDKTKTKEKFLQWMSYIFFMYDPRSNYNYISDLAQRKYEIVTQEGLGKDFKEFDKLKEAIEYYKKLTMTSSTLLIEDTRMAIDKLRAFLRDFDLTEMDDRGKPVYTINTITSAIKQIPQLAQDLAKAEKVITKEIEESRSRGTTEKTITEDGILNYMNK